MFNDSVIPSTAQKPKPVLWKRVRAWTLVVGIYALLVWLAVTFLSSAIRPGIALDDRSLKLLGGTVLVLCGLFREEAERRATDAHTGLDIVLYVAFVLSLIGFGVVCIGVSFAINRLFLIPFGLAFLIYPVLAIRSCIRRFQTAGSLRVSEEEFQSAAVQRVELQNRERQRPLRDKIIPNAIGVVLLGLFWIRATWTTPPFFTILSLSLVWIDFSKPAKSRLKSSRSSFAPAP